MKSAPPATRTGGEGNSPWAPAYVYGGRNVQVVLKEFTLATEKGGREKVKPGHFYDRCPVWKKYLLYLIGYRQQS